MRLRPEKEADNADASWELQVSLWHCLPAQGPDRPGGRMPALESLHADLLMAGREIRPSPNKGRLETITEAFEWDYLDDAPWFDKQTEAVELITPALEKASTVGGVGPEYSVEVAEEVNKTQV